jgi:hypothetical protein
VNHLASRALIEGILNADNSTKAELGQKCAIHLGLNPGPLGGDGGIDGEGLYNGKRIYFQSKLLKKGINASFADCLYGIITRHQSEIVIILAGIGYSDGFKARLQEFHDIKKFKIHLLTLSDYFNETEEFKAAVKDLPPLQNFSFEA